MRLLRKCLVSAEKDLPRIGISVDVKIELEARIADQLEIEPIEVFVRGEIENYVVADHCKLIATASTRRRL